jgi:hypothetical protein
MPAKVWFISHLLPGYTLLPYMGNLLRIFMEMNEEDVWTDHDRHLSSSYFNLIYIRFFYYGEVVNIIWQSLGRD